MSMDGETVEILVEDRLESTRGVERGVEAEGKVSKGVDTKAMG